jgi:hypothetical protein
MPRSSFVSLWLSDQDPQWQSCGGVRRQLIQHVSHDGVILHFDLVVILEDQHGLRLIWDGRFSRLSCFFFGFSRLDDPTCYDSLVEQCPQKTAQVVLGTAIENRWAATVVVGDFRPLRCRPPQVLLVPNGT